MHFVRVHNTLPPCYGGQEPIKCPVEKCGYMFAKKDRLDAHMKKIHRPGYEKRLSCYDKSSKILSKIRCPKCQRPVSSKESLRKHMGTMHAELKFECPKCHKKFCKKGMLDMHLKMRKFDCADGSKVEGYKWPPGQTPRGPRERKRNPLSTI